MPPSPHLSDTLAALNASSRGYYPAAMQDFDTMSVTSAMSGVSTSTLQVGRARERRLAAFPRGLERDSKVKTLGVSEGTPALRKKALFVPHF